MENRVCRKGAMGYLPQSAPLANPYVPFQKENPPTYAPRTALVRGTLFTGLDLPYLGMVNNKEKAVTPLTELQVTAFVIQELTLYMDTHREDKEALELLTEYQKCYEEMVRKYERSCGPLSNTSPCSREEYRWLDDPWPWEYAANRGV